METETQSKPIRSFKVYQKQLPVVLKYGTVAGLTAGGVGLMMGGMIAWVIGEPILFFSCFVAGAVFVAAGATSFLKCLDS